MEMQKILENANSKLDAKSDAIKCIFFCEFHHVTGRQLTFQVPENFISKDIFDSLSTYLIPKKELEGSLITVNARDLKVIGYPVGLSHSKFPRNKMLFNLCIVCSSNAKTHKYEPLVEKLAHYLINLEFECDFLFNQDSKATLPHFLAQIRNQLNANRTCVLPITESTTIYLKVPTVHPDPDEVDDLDVPILNVKPNYNSDTVDLTTQKLLPYLDGIRHVHRISVEAEVDIQLVKAYVQNLIYYGLVRIIPMFQYSNIYVPTARLACLAEQLDLQQKCLQFVTRSSENKPSLRHIFQFYCSMNSGVTVRALCQRYRHLLVNIDEQRLIRFGVLNGLIRRLDKYPILANLSPAQVQTQRGAYRFFDGKHSFDKICILSGLTPSELDVKIDKHPSAVLCWK